MNSFGVLRLWVLFLGVGIVACSSGGNEQSLVCEPGRSIQCAGPNGCIGAQSCNGKGSGYDPCSCGSTSTPLTDQATGGLASTPRSFTTAGGSTSYATGGTPVSTGGASSKSNSSSGGALTATGGSPAISTANCAPTAMAGYKYPNYVPARRLSHSCSEQAIQLYFTDCYVGGECSAFGITGTQAPCGACLAPTELSAQTYGPLLRLGTPNAYFYQTNVAGCEDLMGETSCAPKMQVEFLCEYLACEDSCPLNDASGYYDAMYRCMNDARSTQCSQQQAAATCLTNTASAAACSGADFQEQFIAIAKVFCL